MAIPPISFFVPNAAEPGLSWKVYYYKPSGRPAYVIAIAGKTEVSGDVTFFTCKPLSAESYRRFLSTSRATARSVKEATLGLLAELLSHGLITQADADKWSAHVTRL